MKAELWHFSKVRKFPKVSLRGGSRGVAISEAALDISLMMTNNTCKVRFYGKST